MISVVPLDIYEVTYTEAAVTSRVCATGPLKDDLDHVIEVVVGIRVVVSFRESVDEDSRVWSLEFDGWVGAVVVINGQKGIAHGKVVLSIVFVCAIRSTNCASRRRVVSLRLDFTVTVQKMVTNDRVNLDASKEASLGLEGSEEEKGSRDRDGGVDTVLDGAEYGDEDTSEEDDDLEWRNLPEAIDDSWRSDQVTDGVNDNGGEGSIGNVEENGG